MSLAHRLHSLQPERSIAIIDALKIGQGTSGRNAGFIIDLPHNLDAGDQNIEKDLFLYRLNKFSIRRLEEFKNQFNIDCMWERAGKYMAAREQRNIKGLEDFIKILKACDFDHEYIEQEELATRLGTPYYKAAVYTPDNILMNPSALVRGVAMGLADKVSVFEDSPVLSIQSSERGHTLTTVGGCLHAKTIIHTPNSFAEEFGVVKNRLAPVFTFASLTEPLPQTLVDQYFDKVQPWGLTSAHPAGTTLRLTPDKRILVRNSLSFLPRLQSTAAQREFAWRQHRESFVARFPFLNDLPFRYTWGGMLCMTLNHQSVFERINANTYVVCGCNGVGVAKGTYLGYFMADMIAGVDSEELRFIKANNAASWVPPEPLRTVGARYRLRKEEATAGGDI